MFKNLTELPKNHTSEQTNGPSTTSASNFAQQEACFDFHKQTIISFCDLTKTRGSESDSHKNQPQKCKLHVFFQVQGDSPFFSLHIFSVDNPKGTLPFEQHTKKSVFGTVRTEAYLRYIPPVLPVPNTSVSSVRHQYRYRTLR